MKLLIDTHTLVWTRNETSERTAMAREAIENFDNDIFV
jgi:PIN domain nuclease of toxin-antitoxin system